MIRPSYVENLVTVTAASLDLREPNKEALTTVALRAAEHFDHDDGLFEGVIDVATGVGKTYVIAALVDYYTALGYRNFVVITPGKTVNRKTIANFTAGHPKSLLAGMETRPFVVTSENFASPAVASALADDTIAKMYVFTVQALLTPTSKADRKTHVFQEGLGADFYQALVDLPDLVVLADEYHLYGGKKFSAAVRGLDPQMLIGLTATPPKGSPIIYRYPLAAAIAEGYVKTPVIVGRSDDRADALTKLTDGVRLLDGKRRAVEAYRGEHPDKAVINPVMLVLAPDTEAADECVGILRHPNFEGGAYAQAILNIHSAVDDPDEALAKLDAVEEPDSPVRVIVSVGMLKEGWDVKNVFVICSLRASVSEILTEQTLGRGLRLPWGALTGREMLDTLEVVAHERYDTLIKRVDRMREAFIDHRTAIVGSDGRSIEERTVAVPVGVASAGEATVGQASIADVADRLAHGEEALADFGGPALLPRSDVTLAIPVVNSTTVESPFSLSEITDLEPFRRIGRSVAADPEARLRRTVIEGTVTTDDKGERQAGFHRRLAADPVASGGSSVSVEDATRRLMGDVVASGCVPERASERTDLGTRIIAAVLDGLGQAAVRSLPAFERRTADAVIAEIRAFQGRSEPKVVFSAVEMRPFAAVRHGRATVIDRFGPFARGVGYTGFKKSLYAQDWFDSGSAERDLANLIDDADEVRFWLRLVVGDLPLPWRGGERHYNPDFIVEDTDGIHWVIEGKRDSDADAADVKAKREAARRWANYVTAQSGEQWRYLFVTEADIARAKGSWVALRQLALAD